VKIATTAIVVKHDKQANAAKIVELAREAARESARLVVFPETALQGYMYGINHEVPAEELRYHYREAEPLDGPTVRSIADVAREEEMHLVFGMVELAGAVLYNTAVLCLPDGHVRGFRKVHRGGSELHIFEAGTRVEPIATEVGSLGVNICYDMCFPEIARMHALRGAQLLVFPNAWPSPPAGVDEDDPRISPFLLFPRARAWENQCFVVTSNIVGPADVGDVSYYGHSRIIDPLGRILADTGADEGVVFADIDLEEGILEARTGPFFGYNILKDRRPDVYEGIDESRPFEPAR
jgi:predicted amidohydrolase